MEARTIIVSGLGRCGSSLMMQMLHRGGLECYADFPDFEGDQSDPRKTTPELLESLRGKAIKVLVPYRARPGFMFPPEVAVIWMTRNAVEQSRSQVKFLRSYGSLTVDPIALARTFRSTFEGETRQSRSRFHASTPWLPVRFERVLENPVHMAGLVAAFLADNAGVTVDPERMAQAVVKRPWHCLPDRRIEAALLAQPPV